MGEQKREWTDEELAKQQDEGGEIHTLDNPVEPPKKQTDEEVQKGYDEIMTPEK